MKRDELTAEGVAAAMSRIRQAEQRASAAERPQLREWLEELGSTKGRLDRDEPAAHRNDIADGPAALDFLALLERSSLGTPGAAALRARTGAEALHRIARRREELEQEGETEARGRMAAGMGALLRAYLEKRRHGGQEDVPVDASEATVKMQLRLIVSSESSLPVNVTLHYRRSDPYAVEAVFSTGPHDEQCWFFAREVLTEGLDRPTGTGDVRVWPSRSGGMGVICIALSSPEGEALLEAPAGELRGFLGRTQELVPPGAEGQYVDVDAEMLHLTGP